MADEERQPLMAGGRARAGSLGHPWRQGGPGAAGRRSSLQPCRPRRRTDSITIYAESEEGEDVTSTSYGPVVSKHAEPGQQWALGWVLAVVSGLLFTTNNFFVKFLDLDAAEMLLVRCGLQAAVLGLVIATSSQERLVPSSTADRVLVVLQGLCSGGRVFLQFACLQYLALGDALTLIFTEPLWTLLASRLVLGARIGPWKLAFSAVLLGGMLLCIQPPCIFGETTVINNSSNSSGSTNLHDEAPIAGEYIGALLALGSAVTGAAANVIIAKCQQVSSAVMVFYSGVGGVVLALVFSTSDPANRIVFSLASISPSDWAVLCLLGAMGITGYFCLTRSLQLIPPTTVAVLRAMEIILAYLAQAIVMGELPDLLAISGSSLVMLSVMAFALEEIILRPFHPMNSGM